MASFNSIFKLAMQFKKIEDSKLNLSTTYNIIALDSAFGSALTRDDLESHKKKKELLEKIRICVKKVNGLIKEFNKMLTQEYSYLSAKPIIPLNFKQIGKIIYDHSKPGKLAGDLTLLKINNSINNTNQSIREFFQSFDNLILPFMPKGRKVATDSYTDKIVLEAFDIYSIGHFETAVFLMGKCLDYVITRYLKLCVRSKLIPDKLSDIQNWTFDTKINVMKKYKLVSENEYSKIMAIKWDRNISGHPSNSKELAKLRNDSEAMIKLCVNQIIEISKKINSLKK